MFHLRILCCSRVYDSVIFLWVSASGTEKLRIEVFNVYLCPSFTLDSQVNSKLSPVVEYVDKNFVTIYVYNGEPVDCLVFLN